MKIIFKKSSKKDSYRTVTFNIKGLGLKKGDKFILTIKSKISNKTFDVPFMCNRKDGSTARTIDWPSCFIHPEIGSSVEYEVVYATRR